MNVRPASDLPKSAPVEGVRADRPAARSTASGVAPGGAPASGDRVELSAAAQARSAGASAQSPEVESARVALRAGDGLSDARLHELREQVRTGHYDRPEVVGRVAAAAARDVGRAS